MKHSCKLSRWELLQKKSSSLACVFNLGMRDEEELMECERLCHQHFDTSHAFHCRTALHG